MLGQESWRELVLEIVPKTASLELKLEVIKGCAINMDDYEAAYWIKYYEIPETDLPDYIQTVDELRYGGP